MSLLKSRYILTAARTLWVIVFLMFITNISRAEKHYTIYVAQGEWHTGIILKLDEIPDGILPDMDATLPYNYIDIGWGERDYYMATGGTLSLALNAMLHPTPSVMLLMLYQKHPQYIYGTGSKIIRLELNERQFLNLCGFIANSFVRDDMGKPLSAGEAGFYLSKRKYHLFRTCNTWVAMALKHAGFKIRVFPIITEWHLFAQLNKLPDHLYLTISD
jgi:uncharacterized protein (TIGR02117 family)